MQDSKGSRARLHRYVLAAFTGSLVAIAAPGALAATITVDNVSDADSADGCTLRNAITAANNDVMTGACVAGSGADAIVFDSSIVGATITLNGTALPTVAAGSTLSIGREAGDNGAANSVIIDAGGDSRILANQGTLTLNALTLSNGMTLGGMNTANDRSGGAILNAAGGVLTVNGGSFTGNTADRAGGAIEEASGAASGTTAVSLNGVSFSGNDAGATPGNGGALHVSGSADVVVDGSTFTGNTAKEGGALWNNAGTMTVTDSTFTSNSARGADADQGGGAIFAENTGGTLTISDSRFGANTAAPETDDGESLTSGGAILASGTTTLNISNTRIQNNTATRAGGGIEVLAASTTTLNNVSATNNDAGMRPGNGGFLHVTGSATVNVNGGVFASNTAVEGGAFWNNQGTMTISGANLVGNTATGSDATQGGGAVYAEVRSADDNDATVNINNSRLARNSASGASGSGGAVLVSQGATVNITDSRITGNSANRAGGGIENAAGMLTLTGSSLGGASASEGNDAGSNPGNGGGVHIGGAGEVTITRSTVGYNQAMEGGGLWNSAAGTLNVQTSTVAQNTAPTGAGVYIDGAGGTVNLDFASVVSNRGQGLAAPEGGIYNVNDSLVAANSTDLADAVAVEDGANGNVVGGAQNLGMYRLFGGPTATVPLMAGSGAIDSIDDCDDETDQRGAERPFNDACDSGAFEANDASVLSVARTSPGNISAAIGATDDASVLGLSVSNSAGASTTLGGFSGYIARDAQLPAAAELAGRTLTVYSDANGNGRIDSQDGAVGTGVVADNGFEFSVAFDGGAGQAVAAGSTQSYVLGLDLADANDDNTMAMASMTLVPVYAGGVLLGLLGLVSVGGVRRRTAVFFALVTLTLALTACGGDDDNNVSANDAPAANAADPEQALAAGQLRFVVDQLDSGATDDGILVGDGLPIAGPIVTVTSGS